MARKVITQGSYKKDGFIEYVPTTGTADPTIRSWSMFDIDYQPLTNTVFKDH